MARAGGNAAAAVEAFTKGVAAEDALSYNEPPDWLLPVRERLGVALLGAARARDAERVFREDLRRNVGNPRALLGLARSLEAQRKTAAAVEARKQFAQAWSGADVTLGNDLEVGSTR
jgi:predicted Zn-dependent protease